MDGSCIRVLGGPTRPCGFVAWGHTRCSQHTVRPGWGRCAELLVCRPRAGPPKGAQPGLVRLFADAKIHASSCRPTAAPPGNPAEHLPAHGWRRSDDVHGRQPGSDALAGQDPGLRPGAVGRLHARWGCRLTGSLVCVCPWLCMRAPAMAAGIHQRVLAHSNLPHPMPTPGAAGLQTWTVSSSSKWSASSWTCQSSVSGARTHTRS